MTKDWNKKVREILHLLKWFPEMNIDKLIYRLTMDTWGIIENKVAPRSRQLNNSLFESFYE